MDTVESEVRGVETQGNVLTGGLSRSLKSCRAFWSRVNDD